MKYAKPFLFVVLFVCSDAIAQQPTNTVATHSYTSSHTYLVGLSGDTTLRLKYGFHSLADEQAFDKLSKTDLQHRFDLLKGKNLSPKQKLTLTRIVSSLWEKAEPSDADKYEFASLILHQVLPSELEVTLDSSDAQTNDAFLGRLMRRSDTPDRCASRTPVVDLKTGLGLGFFQGTQDSPSLS